MKTAYPLVELGEVLTQHMEYIDAPEPRIYQKLSVKLYGKGVVLDEAADGALLRMQRHQIAQQGQVILSEIWGKKGAIGLVPPQGDGALCTSHFFLFDICQTRLDPRFLQLIFMANYLEEQLGSEARGTTGYAAVRPKHLLAARIPLPPLDEQRRIVARIEALAARIEEARGLRREATQKANELVEARARVVLASVTARLSMLQDWLDPVRATIQTGPFGAQLGAGDFVDEGTPILTIGNVQYGGLDIRELRHVSEGKARELDRYMLCEGDILFARMGTVGRSCVIPKIAAGWLYNYHLIRVAVDQARADPRYVLWTIQASEAVEHYLSSRIRGATREGVNSRIVGELPCRIPPLDEQRRIVAYLDDLQARVNALVRLQAETAAKLDALLPAVLDRAFRGEL